MKHTIKDVQLGDVLSASGGTSIVYSGVYRGQTVAVKILTLKEVPNYDQVEKAFYREWNATQRIEHPGVVKILTFGATDEHLPYLVMEYVEGRSLRELLHDRSPPIMSIPAAAEIIRQLCTIVSVVHDKGIVHGDIKPDNIIKARDRGLVLLDFGAAVVMTETLQLGQRQRGQIWGTPEYLSPEQACGESPGPASDIYAIGCILYELITGSSPFHHHLSQEQIIQAQRSELPQTPSSRLGGPVVIDDLVARVLAKHPAERPTAKALFDELAKYLPEHWKGQKEQEVRRLLDRAPSWTGAPALLDLSRNHQIEPKFLTRQAEHRAPHPPSNEPLALPRPGDQRRIWPWIAVVFLIGASSVAFVYQRGQSHSRQEAAPKDAGGPANGHAADITSPLETCLADRSVTAILNKCRPLAITQLQRDQLIDRVLQVALSSYQQAADCKEYSRDLSNIENSLQILIPWKLHQEAMDTWLTCEPDIKRRLILANRRIQALPNDDIALTSVLELLRYPCPPTPIANRVLASGVPSWPALRIELRCTPKDGLAALEQAFHANKISQEQYCYLLHTEHNSVTDAAYQKNRNCRPVGTLSVADQGLKNFIFEVVLSNKTILRERKHSKTAFAEDLEAGVYTIRITKAGCEIDEHIVTIKPDETAELRITDCATPAIPPHLDASVDALSSGAAIADPSGQRPSPAVAAINPGTTNASTVDASTVDAGTVDASTVDASTMDASTVDASTVDAAVSSDGADSAARP